MKLFQNQSRKRRLVAFLTNTAVPTMMQNLLLTATPMMALNQMMKSNRMMPETTGLID